jgi:hypothetical protein
MKERQERRERLREKRRIWKREKRKNAHQHPDRTALVEYQEWFLVGGKRATNSAH